MMLATPSATITCLGRLGVLTTSVTTSAVRSVSIEPTAHSSTASVKMFAGTPGSASLRMSYCRSTMNGTGNRFSSVIRATSPIVLVK
jgi:hypothetical protein